MTREERIAVIRVSVEKGNQFKKDLQELLSKRPPLTADNFKIRRRRKTPFNRFPEELK